MKKLTRIAVILAGVAALTSLDVMAQKNTAKLYVTPFYNSEGPTVNIGKFSKELAAANKQSIKATVATMKQEMATLPAVSMFVAAARLYDLGYRDESVYWFYVAQYRARLFQALLDPGKIGGMGAPAFELKSAHNAFQQTLGEYVNGYAGCDQAKWVAVIGRVRTECTTVPDFAKIYPNVKFIPASGWTTKNTEMNAGLAQMATYLKAHGPEMQAARKQNGQDKQFCGN